MTTYRQFVWVAAAIPLLAGCSPKEAPVSGPLELRIDQHAEFELLPREDLFKGFGVNFSLSAGLTLPAAVPAKDSTLQGRLTRFEYTEPGGFPGLPFTIHDWEEIYPQLRPQLEGLTGAPLELTLGEAGKVAAAKVSGPNAVNLLTRAVVPQNAGSLLEAHMPGGVGMPSEKERILDALAQRWEARFTPGPFGELIGRHMVLAPPEAGWMRGAQATLDGIPIGDLPMRGSITYTVLHSGGGRAHLDISAEVEMAPRQERILLPLGMAEPSYEGEGAGWALVDTATNRILRQFFIVEGSGVFEVLMVKHHDSFPFTFRLSVASELEPPRPESAADASQAAPGDEQAEPAMESEAGSGPASTPQNGA